MRGLILAALLACAAAGELHFAQENAREGSCEGGDFEVGLALENATLYGQVYEWMHGKDVAGWNYSRGVRLNGTTDTGYALVSYTTFVEAPTFFARLLRSFRMEVRFPIEVRKEVCVAGQAWGAEEAGGPPSSEAQKKLYRRSPGEMVFCSAA